MASQPVPEPRWTDDILPGLIEAQNRRDSARDAAYAKPTYQPTARYGDRTVWLPVDSGDPYGPLVNKDGFTPDGQLLFPKGDAA